MESLEQAREKLRKRLEELKPREASAGGEKNVTTLKKYTLLIVEDEELNLEALVNTFNEEYEVLSFASAVAALEYIKTNKPNLDVVLTDQRMPKMSGIQLLEELNKLYPRVMKIVLTGYTETRDLIDAINKGEVYRYITKPADAAVLKLEVKQAMEKYRLEQEKHQLVLVLMDKNKALEKYQNELKKTNLEMLRILGTLTELKDPQRARHTSLVAQATEYIVGKLGLSHDDSLNAIQAAHLHEIGKMGLPDWVLSGAGSTTEAAESLYRQHPVLGEAVLLVSERLKDLASIVRSHHEWWNGEGYPDGLKGEAIPVASRILAICDEYDEFLIQFHRGKRDKEVRVEEGVNFLKDNQGTRFDPKIVPLFVEFLDSQAREVKERLLPITDLQEGMVVAQDVLTERGFVIVPKGTTLKKDLLQKIKGFSAYIKMREPVSIYE